LKLPNWSSNRKAKQQAFTLLEVLIASTVFSVVLLIASSAFKFYMSLGSRTVNSELVMKEAMDMIKIRSSIKTIQYYYIPESGVSLSGAKLFFRGSKDGFVAITIGSINFPAQPTRISIEEKRNEKNQLDLVYCEFPNNSSFPTVVSDASCDEPMIIAKNIKSAVFSYFGWPSIDALYGTVGTGILDKAQNWITPWLGSNRGVLPQYIKVLITYEQGEKPYRPSQLWFHISDADPAQILMNNTSDE